MCSSVRRQATHFGRDTCCVQQMTHRGQSRETTRYGDISCPGHFMGSCRPGAETGLRETVREGFTFGFRRASLSKERTRMIHEIPVEHP
jgi:hypothetical protein